MLGHLCVAECLAVLLSSVVDPTKLVRNATVLAWERVKYALISSKYTTGGAYMNVISRLSKRFIETVRDVVSSAEVCNDVKIKDQLSSLVGVGFGIKEHIVQVVRMGGLDIIKCVSKLLAPDFDSLRASVLEVRNYRYCLFSTAEVGSVNSSNNKKSIASPASSSAVVEGGYYRGCWLYVQDSACKELAEKLALFIGKYGKCSKIYLSILLVPTQNYF